jgi:penicillin-binding protein 3
MIKKTRIQLRQRRFVLPALLVVSILLLAACSSENRTGTETTNGSLSTTTTKALTQIKPEDTFALYSQAWSNLDYAGMYDLLATEAKSRVPQASFVERYQKITSGIEAENIKVVAGRYEAVLSSDGQSATLGFAVSMDTLAGSITISDYSMNFLLEDVGGQQTWTVDWTEKLIFPNMEPTDKIRARTINPERGEIRDRNGQGLAINSQLISIGVVPGKFDAVKVQAIPQMAGILGISTARIEKALANATNPDWFYPIVTLPGDASALSAQLTAIDGVQYQKLSGRSYPLGAAAALMIGYIGPITAEELTKHPGQGYTVIDKIGKMGLEQVYEERLRGQKGGEIYLTAGDDTRVKEQIAYQDAVDGEDIVLAIDSLVQRSIYEQMKSDAGAAAAINPQCGEILALVSSPSFDPNLLQTYVPDNVQTSWNEAVNSPFTNRFKAGYAPGSIFKLVTAAIGLKTGVLDPTEALPISGLKWQPDSSWGNYWVTRVKDSGQPVDLQHAFLYSDNIYFAQQALRIGQDKFSQGAAGFGIGEDLPLDYPFYKSQLANKGLGNPVLLADTGYGQGELLVSPLHIALFYGALATNGDIMQPVLEMDEKRTPQVWKSQAIDAADVPLLTADLIQVVENPAGSGYTKKTYQTRILGKTGTAELKTSWDDTQAEENGWFIGMNVDQPHLAIAMMIESVKNRGGSHYVVPLVKQAIDDVFSANPG